MDAVLEAIAKDKACYGIDECEQEATNGRLELLVVTHNYIEEAREEEFYKRVDAILERVQQTQGEVHLLQHVNEQIDSIGGIAGVLRW